MPTCPASPSGTAVVCFRSGTAHVDTSGAATLHFDAPLLPDQAVAHFPGGALALSYDDRRGHAVVVSTVAAHGNTTDSTAHLRLSSGSTVYDSAHGSCAIAVVSSPSNTVNGSFTCHAMPAEPSASNAGTLDAMGTFSASV